MQSVSARDSCVGSAAQSDPGGSGAAAPPEWGSAGWPGPFPMASPRALGLCCAPPGGQLGSPAAAAELVSLSRQLPPWPGLALGSAALGLLAAALLAALRRRPRHRCSGSCRVSAGRDWSAGRALRATALLGSFLGTAGERRAAAGAALALRRPAQHLLPRREGHDSGRLPGSATPEFWGLLGRAGGRLQDGWVREGEGPGPRDPPHSPRRLKTSQDDPASLPPSEIALQLKLREKIIA